MLHDVIQEAEELVTLAPDKMLLKWMNFHIKKAGYKKTVTNFSTDVKVCISIVFMDITPIIRQNKPENSTTSRQFFHIDGNTVTFLCGNKHCDFYGMFM
jgi:hypothetical protein